MSEYREVIIQWHDEPEVEYLTTVCIDGEWNELEDDDNVFFYFSKESEFEDAKKSGNNGYEFRIIDEQVL